MSFEDDLSKLERQVNNFSIAGAAGNFHTGFSIGDDARGSGAGVERARAGRTLEERVAVLEKSFKNFTIRGSHDVSVTGSLVAGGFAISAKQVPSGEAAGGGTGPTPTGACCIGSACSILTAADCTTLGGSYQGDGAVCDPNPCAGACCASDNTCSITTEADCVGTFQGIGTVCDPNPCSPICSCLKDAGITSISFALHVWGFDHRTISGVTCALDFDEMYNRTYLASSIGLNVLNSCGGSVSQQYGSEVPGDGPDSQLACDEAPDITCGRTPDPGSDDIIDKDTSLWQTELDVNCLANTFTIGFVGVTLTCVFANEPLAMDGCSANGGSLPCGLSDGASGIGPLTIAPGTYNVSGTTTATDYEFNLSMDVTFA